MTSRGARKEATLSIRLVWPFARLSGASSRTLDILKANGLEPQDFANPDTRIPHRAVVQLLDDAVKRTGDPLLGLRAGELIEMGDFDVLEYAARATPTLGDAIRVLARYMRLMNGAAELTLIEGEETAEWRYRITDGLPQPSQANDFVVSAALSFSRRNAAAYEPPLEIRYMHPRPAYAEAYDRLNTVVKFGAPYNSMILRKSRLATPMLRTNEGLRQAFELHAQKLIDKLDARDGIVGRVRDDVMTQLGSGNVTMHGTSRRLAMSVATLRRRLEEQGTTFSSIVDELRKQLAEQYLNEQRSAISEIAFLLGFSDVASFDRAFKRWTGISPTKYRASLQNS